MAWNLSGILTQSWNKMTKKKEMKCKKQKLTSFIFQKETWKPQKNKFFFIFFKNNDMQCIKNKTLIYMHIKTLFVLFICSFINAKEKLPTNKSMQMTRRKQKELCSTTTKQTLEFPKVSINPTCKEGLHKRKVNYFGKVKLTNKRRRKQRLISF